MRLLIWLFTIAFALAALAIGSDGGFAGAHIVAQGCALIALLACPVLWMRPGGLLSGITGGMIFTGRDRLMLSLALILATPLVIPWPI